MQVIVKAVLADYGHWFSLLWHDRYDSLFKRVLSRKLADRSGTIFFTEYIKYKNIKYNSGECH